MRLRGKSCVITGGASGIGMEACILFAHEGGRILVVDRDGEGAQRVAGEIRDSGLEAQHFVMDVASAEQNQAMIEAAEAPTAAPLQCDDPSSCPPPPPTQTHASTFCLFTQTVVYSP